MKSPQDSYVQNFIIPDNYLQIITSWTISFQTIAPDETSSKVVAPRLLPPRQLSPHGQISPDNCPTMKFPLGLLFESEIHLSEASIATGDPSRWGIVNILLQLWSFCFSFHVTKSQN